MYNQVAPIYFAHKSAELPKVSCFLSTHEVHECHFKSKSLGFWKAENSTSSALVLLASLLSLSLSLKFFVLWCLPCGSCVGYKRFFFVVSQTFLFFALSSSSPSGAPFSCSSQKKLLKRSNKVCNTANYNKNYYHHHLHTTTTKELPRPARGRSLFCSYHQLTHGTLHDPWGWLN